MKRIRWGCAAPVVMVCGAMAFPLVAVMPWYLAIPVDAWATMIVGLVTLPVVVR